MEIVLWNLFTRRIIRISVPALHHALQNSGFVNPQEKKKKKDLYTVKTTGFFPNLHLKYCGYFLSQCHWKKWPPQYFCWSLFLVQLSWFWLVMTDATALLEMHVNTWWSRKNESHHQNISVNLRKIQMQQNRGLLFKFSWSCRDIKLV